jgi:hypothetical protein
MVMKNPNLSDSTIHGLSTPHWEIMTVAKREFQAEKIHLMKRWVLEKR